MMNVHSSGAGAAWGEVSCPTELSESPTEFRDCGAGAKRAFDLLLTSILLPLILPVIGILWALVRLDGGPGFFGQTRIGRGGRPFTCLKLRTMVPDAEKTLRDLCASDPAIAREWEVTQKLRNDPRITKVGQLARKTSLDELPQIWNVLRGEMSLVGPRPVVPGELFRYREKASDYLAVTPGLTGLWQISGRNQLSYDERILLDSHYARNRTLALDFLILCKTVPEVLWRRSGV